MNPVNSSRVSDAGCASVSLNRGGRLGNCRSASARSVAFLYRVGTVRFSRRKSITSLGRLQLSRSRSRRTRCGYFSQNRLNASMFTDPSALVRLPGAVFRSPGGMHDSS